MHETSCSIAPLGWRCSREAGHDGPCAAHQVLDVTPSSLRARQFTVEETERLVDLISVAIDGTEHGVVTYTMWKQRCQDLKELLATRGYHVRGQAFV